MRIYLPMTAEDRPQMVASVGALELVVGRRAWGLTQEARADRPGEDQEDLEYDALQDAVHVAYGAALPTSRALVIAADVDEGAVEPDGDGGAYGVLLRTGTSGRIASFHVTELDARSAAEDDTDPALLWFDASEGPDALAYLDGAAPQ